MFWNEEIFARLTLPGLAMLLIIAKETNVKKEVWFTYEQAAGWYGMSAKSVQNGIGNLRNHKLVHTREQTILAPLSKTGLTSRTWYSLTGDFGHEARQAMRKKAAQSARLGSPLPSRLFPQRLELAAHLTGRKERR